MTEMSVTIPRMSVQFCSSTGGPQKPSTMFQIHLLTAHKAAKLGKDAAENMAKDSLTLTPDQQKAVEIAHQKSIEFFAAMQAVQATIPLSEKDQDNIDLLIKSAPSGKASSFIQGYAAGKLESTITSHFSETTLNPSMTTEMTSRASEDTAKPPIDLSTETTGSLLDSIVNFFGGSD